MGSGDGIQYCDVVGFAQVRKVMRRCCRLVHDVLVIAEVYLYLLGLVADVTGDLGYFYPPQGLRAQWMWWGPWKL